MQKRSNNFIHSMHLKFLGVAIACLCFSSVGCHKPLESKQSNQLIKIAFAPEIISTNDWSILYLSQYFVGDELPVELDDAKVESRFAYARLIDLWQEADGPLSKSRTQIIKIRPLASRAQLTRDDFRNLPQNYHFRAVNISFQE